jgi:hypothetical protein
VENHKLASAASSRDPATGLRAVWALRTLCDQLEDIQVRNARRRGWTWQQIAEGLNVTRQAVHKKHAARLNMEKRLNAERKGRPER